MPITDCVSLRLNDLFVMAVMFRMFNQRLLRTVLSRFELDFHSVQFNHGRGCAMHTGSDGRHTREQFRYGWDIQIPASPESRTSTAQRGGEDDILLRC